MDPCPFVRLLVGNLAVKLPAASRPAGPIVHPTSTPCFCKIALQNSPSQTAPLPLHDASADSGLAAAFRLSRADIERHGAKPMKLKLDIYMGRRGSSCGVSAGRRVGKVRILVDLKAGDVGRIVVFCCGWMGVGKGGRKGLGVELHVVVRSEPDPRFVFEFGGGPESSPQVFQVRGGLRQPVFTCRFSCRNASGDRRLASRY